MKRRQGVKRCFTVEQHSERLLTVTMDDADGQRLVALFVDGALVDSYRDLPCCGMAPLRAADSWFASFANDVHQTVGRWPW